MTFKQGKGDESKKGWAPVEYIGKTEKLYWLDGVQYRVLDDRAWESIEIGKVKL